MDTRPAERSGLAAVSSDGKANERSVAWTYYYEVSDTYSRFDYILLSPGMAREWVVDETYVFVSPDWRLASDHRPLVATIQDADK